MNNTYIFADRGPNSAVQCRYFSNSEQANLRISPDRPTEKKRESKTRTAAAGTFIGRACLRLHTPDRQSRGFRRCTGQPAQQSMCLSIAAAAAAEQRTQTKRSLRSRLIHLHFSRLFFCAPAATVGGLYMGWANRARAVSPSLASWEARGGTLLTGYFCPEFSQRGEGGEWRGGRKRRGGYLMGDKEPHHRQRQN